MAICCHLQLFSIILKYEIFLHHNYHVIHCDKHIYKFKIILPPFARLLNFDVTPYITQELVVVSILFTLFLMSITK